MEQIKQINLLLDKNITVEGTNIGNVYYYEVKYKNKVMFNNYTKQTQEDLNHYNLELALNHIEGLTKEIKNCNYQLKDLILTLLLKDNLK